MKRILCIISSLDAGGAETMIMKIYRVIPPDQYQLDFIVSKEGGCYTDEVLGRGGKVYFVPMRTKNILGAVGRIISVVKENEFDCILKLTDTPLGVVDLLAAKMGGAKRLAVRSCNALTGLSLWKRAIYGVLRPLLNCVADVKLAPSLLAAEFTFGKKEANRNVHILNNALDLNVYHFDEYSRAAVRSEFGFERKTVIGHIGRLTYQKNHKFLLRVFEKIHRKNPDSVLLLVGTGELEDEIRRQAGMLGITSSVVFAGIRFDIPQILSAMDVFVFPSFFEGMPNTVIEAQATGLPSVIADTITKDADITGLVRYVPLEKSPDDWADVVFEMLKCGRINYTKDQMIEAGYDITDVALRFVELLT